MILGVMVLVQQYVNVISEKMTNFCEQRLTSCEATLDAILQNFNDTKPSDILNVMKTKKSTTEDKIIYIACVVFEDDRDQISNGM